MARALVNKQVQQTVNNKVAVDKSLIESGQYDPGLIIPTNAKIYPRSSAGSILIDSNIQNISDYRLVINLTGIQYKKNSFEEIIDINFSEFLDPEIEYEESSETKNTLDQVPGLQQQIAQKDEQIKQLTESLSDLQDSLQGVNQQIQDLNASQINASQINTTQNQPPDDTKGRIFTDGTLLRDRDRPSFYYIIEDGKKRWFWFNADLAFAAAKAFGKVNATTGAIDWIDVSQYILDRIPSGANFEAEDLVKNKKTPAPPPIVLPNGERIIGQWVTDQNPIVIRTTTLGYQKDLKISLSAKFTTDTGKVNVLEVWDDSIPWFEGKYPLPVKASGRADTEWGFDKSVGDWGPDYPDKFDVWIKDTSTTLSGNQNSPRKGLDYVNRYSNIYVDKNNPVKELTLKVKLFNDTNGEGFSDKLTIRIELQPEPMPNVIGERNIDVTQQIRDKGIGNEIKLIQGLMAPSDNLINDIYKQSVPAGTTLTLNSSDIIELTYYGAREVTIPEWRYQDWKLVGRYLKDIGFTKFNITYTLTSFEQEHFVIQSLGYNANPQSWAGLSAGQLVNLNTTLAVKVYLYNYAKSIIDPNKTYQQLNSSNNPIERNKIYTDLRSIIN